MTTDEQASDKLQRTPNPADFNLKNLLRLPVDPAAKVILLEMIRSGERGPAHGGSYFLFELAEQLDIHRAVAEAAKRHLERLDICFREVPSDHLRLIGNSEWARVLSRSDPDIRATLKSRDEEIDRLTAAIAKLKAESASTKKAATSSAVKVERAEVARAAAESEAATLRQLLDEANARLPKSRRLVAKEGEAPIEPASTPAPSEPTEEASEA